MATSARLDELKKKFDESPRRYFAPLANEFRKLGDLTQAVALCRAHLPNQPGHVSGHIVLAQALYESKELGESRLAFEQALDLDPENLIALRYLGDIAREQEAPDVARAWYERVLDADPRNEEIATLLNSLPSESSLAESAPSFDAPSVESQAATSVVDFSQESEVAPTAPSRWETPSTASFDSYSEPSRPTPPPPALILHDSPIETDVDASELYAPIEASASSLADTDHNDVAEHDTLDEFSEVVSEDEFSVTAHSAVDPFSDAFADAEARRNEVISLSDLEAIAEPRDDDWFQEREEETEAATAEGTAFAADFFPDLASVTPTASDAVAIPSLELSDFTIERDETPPMGVDGSSESAAFPFAHAIEIPSDASAAIGDIVAEPDESRIDSHDNETLELPLEIEGPPVVAAGGATWILVEAVTSSASDEELVESIDEHVGDSTVTPFVANEIVSEAQTDELLDFTARETPPLPVVAISPWDPTPVPDAFRAIDPSRADEVEADPYSMGAPELSAHRITEWEERLQEGHATPAFSVDAVTSSDAEEVTPTEAPVAMSDASMEAEVVDYDDALAADASDDSAPVEGMTDESTSTDQNNGVDDDSYATAVEFSTNPEHNESADAVAESDSFDHDPFYGRTPAFGNRAVEPTPSAFVTETMAELYLQQGFVDDALSIYRQLLERNPEDATLRERVNALLSPATDVTAPAVHVERSGQSARAFFAQFARREPRRSSTAEDGLPLADAGDAESPSPAQDVVVSTYSGVATRDEALTVPDEPDERAASLEELFGSRSQSSADETAAETLSAAFSSELTLPTPHVRGEEELSLEHLFGDVPAQSSSTVSLDEFFSAGREESNAPNSGAPAGEERADIEQFTAWLEGLKKK